MSGRVYEARVQMNSETPETVPLVHHLLNYHYSTRQMMQDNEIISEAMAHMCVLPQAFICNSTDVYNLTVIRIAGSDTTAILISYFLWELSHHADIAAKLQAEIDEAMHDPRVIPDIGSGQSSLESGVRTKSVLNIFLRKKWQEQLVVFEALNSALVLREKED